MHPEARTFVEAHRADEVLSVLEIGGRWINGGVRDLFPNASPYVSLDITPGEAVDIVANAATWVPDRTYDLIVCTEVFEHTPEWPDILATAFAACAPGGRIILTMAGPGRSEHGAHGSALAAGEFYANVDPDDLREQMNAVGWADVTVDYLPSPGDTRATATKEAS